MLVTTFVQQLEPQQWGKSHLTGSHCIPDEGVLITAHPECQKAPRLVGQGQGLPEPPGRGSACCQSSVLGRAGEAPREPLLGTRVPPLAQRRGFLI